MQQRLLGFFSGFPDKRFPRQVAETLATALTCRVSLVFISAWPSDDARNDDDATGMHAMFAEWGIPFAHYAVIDERTDAALARQMIREASCVFLMGGHPGLQYRLIGEKGLAEELRASTAVILGVSAGAINMAVTSLDTKESLAPYAGVGLADVTVKPHFRPEDMPLTETLLQLSRQLPICAMEDESAIFVSEDGVTHIGRIHRFSQGTVRLL